MEKKKKKKCHEKRGKQTQVLLRSFLLIRDAIMQSPMEEKKKKAQSYITTHKLERQEGKKRKQTDHAYTRAHIQTDIKGTKPI